MEKKNHQSNVLLFLNSYHGDEIQPGVFKFHLNNPIYARRDNIIKVELVKFEIPVSMYNFSASNNRLDIQVAYKISASQFDTFNITFPEKNYNINDIVSYINNTSPTTNITLSAAYDKQRLKLNITATKNNNSVVGIHHIKILDTTTCSRTLGLLTADVQHQLDMNLFTSASSLTLEASSVINLSFPQVIFVKTDMKLENRDSHGEMSSVLSKIDIDKDFGQILHYKDESPITFDIADKYIDHVNIQLLDDDFDLIKSNGANFHCTLSFTFHNKSTNTYEGTLLDKVALQEKILRNNNYDQEDDE